MTFGRNETFMGTAVAAMITITKKRCNSNYDKETLKDRSGSRCPHHCLRGLIRR